MGVKVTGHGPTPEHVQRAFLAAAEHRMKRAMVEVEGEVKRRAPFRTGHLRQSITSTVKREGYVMRGFVGTTTRYAPFLEFGTGLYGPRHKLIVPVRARALRFPAGGRASGMANGRRTQGSAGPGFRLSGQTRAGAAGANARWVFARSVRGIHPMRFFEEAMTHARPLVEHHLASIANDARRALAKP